MQSNEGDDLDPDDYSAIDFTEFDAEMRESLKSADLSFPVPDLSDCDDAEVAAAWVKSPKLMLQTLTFRLNEILEICEARSFPGTTIQLKPKYIYTDEEKRLQRLSTKAVLLTGVAFVFLKCGHIVDIVNSIQATPFEGKILVEFARCIHLGNTPEFDRSIKCYKGALRQLAIWIKARSIQNGNETDEPSEAPRTIWSILKQLLSQQTEGEATNGNPAVAEQSPTPNTTSSTATSQYKTVRNTVVLESELTRDERPSGQWCIILGHVDDNRVPISKSTFHNRIRGKGSNPLDAVLVLGQKYRLRTNQLPTDAKTESARNAIIEAVPRSKRGRKKK